MSQLSDNELMERFVDAIRLFGDHEAADLVGLSHTAVYRYRRGEWKRIYKGTRRKIEAFLETQAQTSPDPPAEDSQLDRDLPTRSISAATDHLRKALQLLEGQGTTPEQALPGWDAGTHLTGHAHVLEGARSARFLELREAQAPLEEAHQKAWSTADDLARSLLVSGELAAADLTAWMIYRESAIRCGVYEPEHELDTDLQQAALQR